jgi:Protein of unknown function (DUF3307)
MTNINTIADAFLLLLALQVKHVICDGPLQTLQMVRDKSVYAKPLGILHASIHSGASLVVLLVARVPITFAVQLVALEFFIHYHIDFLKETYVKRHGWYHSDGPFWWALILDQTLHHMTYVLLVWLVIKI